MAQPRRLGAGCGDPPLKLVRLFMAGFVFLLDPLFVFLRLFGFLFAFILLAFVSHSFILQFFDLAVQLRGRISERLFNWSPCDECRARQSLYS